MTGDRQQDVAFEPMRIGRRRRGPDPFLVGVVVVVGGLLLAVIKPWDGPTRAAGASSSPRPTASASPSPTAVALGTILFDDPLATVSVLDVLEPHDEWGVQVVERAPDFRTGYRERWLAPPATGGRAVTFPVGEPTLAIGITTPANETPLDVRVFERVADDRWSWLDVPRVTTDRPAGSLLLRPPRVRGSDQAAWPAGTYRVELLMGTSIETIDVTLPYPTTRVPPPAPGPEPDPRKTDEILIGAVTDPGAVLLDDGFVVPLAVAPGGPLDEAHAWLAERRTIGAGAPAVASVWDPYARTLGVMLPTDASRVEATLARLTPPGEPETPQPIVMTDLDRGVLSFVAFQTPDGLRRDPGTYAMRVRWRDGDGRHDQTWHVTLLPGEPDAGPEPAMLRAARAFAGLAGRDGIVVGPSFGRDVGPDDDRATYLAFDRSVDQAEVQAIACDETFIGGKPEVIGISHPIAVSTTSIGMELTVPGGETRVVPLRTAELVGLTLVEPALGASFAQGVYRIGFGDAAGDRTSATICLGTSPFEG